MATKAYLLTYLSGGREEVTQVSEIPSVGRSWREDYPAWDDTPFNRLCMGLADAGPA